MQHKKEEEGEGEEEFVFTKEELELSQQIV